MGCAEMRVRWINTRIFQNIRETFEMQIKMETDVNGTGMTRRMLGSEFNKFIRFLCLFDGWMEIRRIFSMYAVLFIILFIISSRGYLSFIHLKLGFMTSQTSKQESQCPVSASELSQPHYSRGGRRTVSLKKSLC